MGRDSLYFEYNGKSLIPLLQAVLIMSQCQAPDKATGEQQRTRHVTHILSNGLSQNFRHRLTVTGGPLPPPGPIREESHGSGDQSEERRGAPSYIYNDSDARPENKP